MSGAALSQYDYLFAIGTIFAFLDAWNIGANDVANSWASSVSSRSLTYLQAMCGASVLEFAGAVGVGGRVADTIRTKIVDVNAFDESPGLLMLGMVCAVIASSVYLTFATKVGFPVSTTHSILGGVLGMGFGALGSGGVVWVGYKDDGSVDIQKGVVQVFLAWIIAPVLSGTAGAIIFLATKYGILLRNNSPLKAILLVPVYAMLTGVLISMLLVWKGGGYEVQLSESQIPGVIVGAGAAFGLLVAFFGVPYLYRLVIKDDWQLRPWHIFQGPLLLRRGEVPPTPDNYKGRIRDFYEGHLTKEELTAKRAEEAARRNGDVEARGEVEKKVVGGEETSDHASEEEQTKKPGLVGPKPEAPIYSPAFLWWGLKFIFLRGVDRDIVASQKTDNIVGGDVAEIHTHAQHFDNRSEFAFTFLQIMTASTASFVHGANDVANAIGPFASIYQIWRTGVVPGSEANVPIWILAFGGAGIAVGVWTYGYRIMANLGNRVTLMSPSRGFSMELGSVIAVVIATRLGKFGSLNPLLNRFLLTAGQNFPSRLLSASPAPSSVSVSAMASGALSIGAWLLGSTWVGSSPCPLLV